MDVETADRRLSKLIINFKKLTSKEEKIRFAKDNNLSIYLDGRLVISLNELLETKLYGQDLVAFSKKLNLDNDIEIVFSFGLLNKLKQETDVTFFIE